MLNLPIDRPVLPMALSFAMPADAVFTAEPPPKRPPHRFNRENARANAIRGNQSPLRRAKRLAKLYPPVTTPTPTPSPQDIIMRDIAEELEIVTEQIVHTRKLLNDENFEWCIACERGGVEPHHRAQLLKALDALLDRKRILAGRPLPGSRRPTEAKEPSVLGKASPMDYAERRADMLPPTELPSPAIMPDPVDGPA